MELSLEVSKLKKLVLEMQGQVLVNLEYALKTLVSYDPNTKYEPIDDLKVDAYERAIEEKCLHLMLTERLFSTDMRLVSGVMCMVEDLERLGDHAQDIMEFALKVKNTKVSEFPKLNVLVNFVYKMVKDATLAFKNEDAKLASEVISSDDYVDKTYVEILNDLIRQDSNNQITSSYALYSTLIDKYLERLADHATNIAEWVIFINTGFYKDTQII